MGEIQAIIGCGKTLGSSAFFTQRCKVDQVETRWSSLQGQVSVQALQVAGVRGSVYNTPELFDSPLREQKRCGSRYNLHSEVQAIRSALDRYKETMFTQKRLIVPEPELYLTRNHFDLLSDACAQLLQKLWHQIFTHHATTRSCIQNGHNPILHGRYR